MDLRSRLLEVRSGRGDVLYHSAQLGNGQLSADQKDGFYQDLSGHRHRLAVFSSGGVSFYLNAEVGPNESFIHEIGGGLLLAVPAMFVIIVFGGLWLRDRALRPVQNIRQRIARITPRSLNRPLPAPAAPEEISELVSTLNVAFKQLHINFEQPAGFSADASHQLKTPLTVLRLGIKNLLMDPQTPSQQRPRIDELLRQIHRLTSIVEELLLLSRADAGCLGLQREKCDGAQLFSSFVDDISTLAQEKGLTLEATISAQGWVLADRSSVAMILENLMENAVKYNRPGGRIKLAISESALWTDITF